MLVKVTNIYGKHTREFEGSPEELMTKLVEFYPFLKRYRLVTLGDVLQRLRLTQSFIVQDET